MNYVTFCKSFLKEALSCAPFLMVLGLSACTVNPATGDSQFTALMSPAQEMAEGTRGHEEAVDNFGGEYENEVLQSYVNGIGQRLAAHTERKDVSYHFTLLDTPVMNAFARPGGYVYITRGILSVANDEDELAAVIAHEIGHVTGRHSAERYSQGVLTSLGASIVGAVVGQAGVSQALNVGSSLYLSSYTRGQESQADDLGVRYLTRGGYDPYALSRFLRNMEMYDETDRSSVGEKKSSAGFFATHPSTDKRVAESAQEAAAYSPKSVDVQSETRKRAAYLSKIRGMVYGDSARHGFVRGGVFYHPELGFAFSVPDGYRVINQPEQIIMTRQDGTIMVMDMQDADRDGQSPSSYLAFTLMKGKGGLNIPQSLTVNGLPAATVAIDGKIDNKPVTVRVVAIKWGDEFVRFQIILPRFTPSKTVEELKRSTYSFHRLTAAERRNARPLRIDTIVAGQGDSVQSLARHMRVDKMQEQWFRSINGLGPRDRLVVGRMYKILK